VIQFTRILCPIDFSDVSIRALTYATALAAWYEARLDVLHVAAGFEDSPLSERAGHTGERFIPTAREDILSEMGRAIDAAGAAGQVSATLTQEGRAHQVIADYARTQASDLIVMGTHGRSGFNRLLLGSVTEKVLRIAPCPVLTVPPASAGPTIAGVVFKRVICAIDYSPSSLASLRYALELGRQAAGRVTVLYALEYLEPDQPFTEVDVDSAKRRQLFTDHARERLHVELGLEPTTWCEIDEVVAVDRAYRAILQEARTSEADLIVMGAQGMSGLELMVYGSNTQHVLRAATCPVLTVHA
jgi:nucleotide-binding universal stress UspA family protein